MMPNTAYPEKAQSLADLMARLPLAAERLTAAVADLTPAECAREVIPGKWTVAQCVEHIVLVSLGWMDLCYQAMADDYPTPWTADRQWKAPLEAEARQSMADALALYHRHLATAAQFLATLPETDFRREFKQVAWLPAPFQLNESVNWGLVIHCDYHLAYLHQLRTLLGKPLEWMAIYLERYPKP